MLKIIRNIAVAFSLYSKIPMPNFAWKKEDTKLAIAFLPWIGLIIGGIEYALLWAGAYLQLNIIVRLMLWCVVPLLITGGFHMDGFMDVMDALKSYKPKEEKLKILKDPHVGAFSIISLVTYGLIFIAVSTQIIEKGSTRHHLIAALCFFLVRAMCALLSIKCAHAKKEGMLHEETKESNLSTQIITIIELLAGITGMAFLSWQITIALVIALGLFTLWFYLKCKKEFGGVTGDTMGYYVCQGEQIALIVVALAVFLADRWGSL